jgi:hypothetical protein
MTSAVRESGFLTGLGARFGMTRVNLGWLLSQRCKRCATQRLYAALKRRSFTVLHAFAISAGDLGKAPAPELAAGQSPVAADHSGAAAD